MAEPFCANHEQTCNADSKVMRYHPAMTARLMFRFLIILTLAGLACQPGAAQGLIAERAIFVDPHGALTLKQVQQAKFSPTGAIISLGYTRATVWVRLKLDVGDAHVANEVQRLKLRVIPIQLEEVTLYSALLPDEGQRLIGGATWIAAHPGPGTYYLRIKNSAPILLQPRILSEEQAQEDEVMRGFILGAVLAFYAPLLVWLLVLLVRRRQLLHGALLLNLSLVVVTSLSWMGYFSELAGAAHWINDSSTIHFLGVANVFSGFLCVYLLLHHFGMPRWGRQLFGLLGMLYCCLFALFFVLDRQLVLQCSTGLGLMASVIGLPLTLAVFTRQKSDSWLIGAIIFSALVFGLRWFLTVYTLLPVSDSMANLLIFRLIFGMCFVSVTLWLIDRELKNQLQASIMSEAVARQQAKSETLRREIQERFMTMLVHEIKTPLAIIQFAASSLGRQFKHASAEATRVKNINRSVDDLNALVERCVSADQLDQGAMEMHKVSLCLATLTTDVMQNLDAGRIALTGSAHLNVFSDATYLRLILLNLLSNALKYSPPDSLVEFSIASMEQDNKTGVNLQVTNAVGVAGVPDAQQVFARYYRAEGARREIGAGLGLWLSHALARQLGSELKFQASTERVSFSFFLELA